MSYPGSGGPHDPEDSRQPPGQPSAGSGEHHDQPGPYGNQPGQYGGQPDPYYGDQSGQYGQPGYGGQYGQYANEQPGGQYGYQQPAGQYGNQQPGGQYGNQQPGGQYGNPGQYGQHGQSSRTNVLAILSLVFAFVFAPAGIALGHLALRQIGRTGERGRQLALSGLILSYFFTALYLVGCCGWLALAGWAGSDGGGSAY